MLLELDALEHQMARYSPCLSRIGPEEIEKLFPPLKTGAGALVAACLEPDGLRLDADALLQSYAKAVGSGGGEVLSRRRIASVRREGGCWSLQAEDGELWRAPVLINAAGAWADEVAKMAGVRPLGLQPLRRTIIVLDPPAGEDVRSWPFVKSVVDDFYILPEGGQLIASPVDEIPTDPCDARPEEYDVALAAWKVQKYTTLPVSRIGQRWAGLRSFTTGRTPTAGFAPDAPGFFWLAGHGGFGLQTAPAMAEIVEALVTRAGWPPALAALGVSPDLILPDRLFES
jgi:D-arginine dehydrogenase